jgi:hypothetical protein
MAAAFLLAAFTFYMQDVFRQGMSTPQAELPLFILPKIPTFLSCFLIFVLFERVAIAQSSPEGRLTWRLTLAKSPGRDQNWIVDLATSIFVALASHKTAFRLFILSPWVWFFGGLLSMILSDWIGWIAEGIVLLLLSGAIALYSTVPIERIRRIASTGEETLSRWSDLLDC